jgi:hypothetical protein
MTGEDQERSLDLDDARSNQPARAGSKKLGLIAAPEIPEKIARELADELPGLLGKHVYGSVSWEVSVVVDPLTGTGREAPELLDACRELLKQEGWDLAVCLTDLPLYRDAERLLPINPQASGRSCRLPDPGLAGDLAGHCGGGHWIQPRTRGQGARDSLRLPAEVPQREVRVRGRL